jgi:hypothetical protein
MAKPQTTDPLAALLRKQREEREKEAETIAVDATVAPPATHATTATVAGRVPEPLRIATVAPPATHAAFARPDQHTRFPNEYLDHILRTLKPNEQCVLTRLCRLTWGFQRDVCKVSLGRLAEATNVSKRVVSDCINTLESRGFIRRLEPDLKNSNKLDRGLIIEMLLQPVPRARTATDASGATHAGNATVAGGAYKKVKDLKGNIEKGLPSALDATNCPDCHGTGFLMKREGDKSGAVKCKHEALKKSPA